MDHRGALLPSGPVADVGPSSLVVAEPRHRGDLQPLVDARGVHLDVEGPGRGVAQVSGTQVKNPVGQTQVEYGRLGPGEDVGVHLCCLVGRGVGQQLHLVELVDPQEPASVPTSRAGLTAEA